MATDEKTGEVTHPNLEIWQRARFAAEPEFIRAATAMWGPCGKWGLEQCSYSTGGEVRSLECWFYYPDPAGETRPLKFQLSVSANLGTHNEELWLAALYQALRTLGFGAGGEAPEGVEVPEIDSFVDGD